MAKRDNYHIQKVSQVVAPAVRTADVTSSTVDMFGFESALLIAEFGTAGDTLSGSVKIEAEVQHSDDDSSYSACADADLLNAVSGATNTGTFAIVNTSGKAAQAYSTGYIGSKRYVKVVLNVTGTHTNGTPSAALAVQGHPAVNPATP